MTVKRTWVLDNSATTLHNFFLKLLFGERGRPIDDTYFFAFQHLRYLHKKTRLGSAVHLAKTAGQVFKSYQVQVLEQDTFYPIA